MEYSKIQTLFKRDDAGIIIPTEFTYPEFEFMKNCKFRGELKVDGCLERSTRIIMADGTAKNITEVQVGDIILGYDTEGNEGVKEVQVQAVTQRPRAGVWVKIISTRNNIGGGSNKGKTICTFDHKIWTPDRGYIEAHKLLPGDKILSVHRFSELSPIQYHTELVEQTIISVTEEKHSHVRWDLTTETHNFFTTSGLVHNTNTRVELYPNSDITKAFIEFKGRTDRAIIPEPLQIELNRLFNEEKVINYFDNSENDFNEPIIIYGEGYGKKIQSCGGKYCKDHAKFIVFDIKIGEWWLNRESIEQICKDLNLEVVPIMGYFTLQEAIDFVKTGFKDPIAEEDLDAEGLVLKTDLNIRRKNGERIITKIKTRDFRKYEAKYGKDYINHQLKNEPKV